jgi:hypothetical protein
MNPYTPPTPANAAAPMQQHAGPAHRHPNALFMLGLCVAQFVWLLSYSASYVSIVNYGIVSAASALCSVAGCALVYAGAIGFVANTSRGGYRFLAGAIVLGLSLFGWKLSYNWTYPFPFGIACGLLGFFLVRRSMAGATPKTTQ